MKIVFGLSDYTELSEEKVEQVGQWVNRIADEEIQYLFRKVLSGRKLSVQDQDMIAYNLFEGKYLVGILERAETETEGLEAVKKKI